MLTPGKFMFAEPLKLTPPIVRAVVRVAADPVVFWFPPVFTPGRLMSAEPLKLTPPIFLAVCSVVAVVALPDSAPLNVVVVSVLVLGLYVMFAAESVNRS